MSLLIGYGTLHLRAFSTRTRRIPRERLNVFGKLSDFYWKVLRDLSEPPMNQKEHNFYEFGPFSLDVTEGVLLRGSEPVRLTPKAFKLLLVLVQNSGHILDKDELMKEVWPNVVVEETNLAGNIYALRQVLGEGNDEERYIETIPKRGYRFVARVREVPDKSPVTRTQGLERSISESASSKGSVEAPPIGVDRPAKQRSLSRVLLVGVILFALTGAAFYSWKSGRSRAPDHNVAVKSIAVLPLKNFSGDPAQEYFADGMTEAMINELAKIGSLKVISRTSTMQYKDTRKTTPEIARELNVDAVVEGSVMRSGDRVRITAQLIRAATDEHLWAESYDRDLSDVLALQREIARGIAGEIKIKLTPQEQQRLATTPPTNPSAHEAYLKGLYYWNQAINTPQPNEYDRLLKKSLESYEQAIKFDPNYALAYSSLATSYHWLASENSPQFYPNAKEAALKALALDDTLGQAHGALAYTIWRHEWDFAGAEREFKKADELTPNSYIWGYAQFLSTIGRHDEAIRKMKIAQDLDPLTMPVKIGAGRTYFQARQYDQAIAQFRRILELNPNQFDAHPGLGAAYMLKGMNEEGIAEFQRVLDLSGGMYAKKDLAWAYAMAGRRNDAFKILDDLKDPSKQKSGSHLNLAIIYGALGEKELGLAQLEVAYTKREQEILWLKVEPQFDGLRSDPRFDDLLRRIGFPQ
jgi:TolB-like protein/DNA-binding winged helix-turn-helix (wHTH) protein